MSRKYQPVEYNSSFQGSAQSVPFDPQRAFDNSDLIKARAAAKIDDIKTMAAASARQYELEQSILLAQRDFNLRGIQSKGLGKGLKLASRAADYKQQAFEENSEFALNRAVKMGQMQADEAHAQAAFSTMKGLMSLAPSMMGAAQQIAEFQQQRAEEDQLLESIGWGEVPLELTPEAKAQETQQQLAISAESKAITQVATETLQEPTLQNQTTAHVLQESSTYNQTKAATANAFDAAASHSLFISEALRNLPPEQMPKTAAEAQVLLRELNRQFLRSTGMMSADRASLLRVARVMYGNTTNIMTNLVTSAIKTQQENNQIETKGFISNLVEDASLSPEEVWKQASERYAYGNVGYTGFSAASNLAALENVLQEAAEQGNLGLINQLREVAQVPGQAGTELGKRFDNVFDKYESQARKQLIENYNLDQTERDIQTKQSIEFYYDSPTPENRQKAIAILREIGTEDALKEADRLAANGLSYDPQKKFELLEMKQRGIDIPEDQLRALLDSGTISAEEYKMFSKGPQEDKALKKADEYVQSISSGIKAAMQDKAGPQDLTAEVRAELTVRHQMLMEDIRRSLAAEISANPSLADNPTELARIAEAKVKFFMQQPQYKLQMDPKRGYYFAADISAERRLARITVAPGVQDFSKFTPEQVFGQMKIPKSEMDATRDRFLTLNELKADVKAVLAGNNASNRARLFARNLGMSSRAFVEAQLRVNGLPSLSTLSQGPEAMQALNFNRNIPNSNEGFRVLKTLNVPSRGAAYLAGNIQQESGWNGMRTWGEVNGDGSDRNGGLVSWSDQSARGVARLRNAERHFGKPIAQVPEPEQLKYMLQEMKRSYPEAYRIFMNPNSSTAELKRASYLYWGYGEEGARFRYAEALLSGGSVYSTSSSRTTGRSGYVGSTNVVAVRQTDYKGRPIKFSPAAASGWNRMVSAGMPFNPADVKNTYRNEAEYLRLRSQGYNAASNSAHNHGNGIDVHGRTGAWIRQYGAAYGWVLVDYEDSHGGHFEFRPNS